MAPTLKLYTLVGWDRSFFVCCLVHRGSSDDLLLQISSGAVWQSRDLQLSRGSAVAWWLMPRTPDPEVGGSSPTRVKPCCVLEQGTITPQKVLVIPRKRWLRPNMTEKVFTGTLRINQPTNQPTVTQHVVSVESL